MKFHLVDAPSDSTHDNVQQAELRRNLEWEPPTLTSDRTVPHSERVAAAEIAGVCSECPSQSHHDEMGGSTRRVMLPVVRSSSSMAIRKILPEMIRII
jgi:hypothetical protein